MTIGIRGMGLIGGSFEKAFAAAGHEVLNLKDASAAEISRCQLVIVCLPPLLVAPWIREHAADFAADALITDAAGVKQPICADLADLTQPSTLNPQPSTLNPQPSTLNPQPLTYIGGHPMAGKERSGYANSDATLYQGASMIFTPYEWTPPAAVERLKEIFATIGFARFVVTTPKRHDEMIAYTSQLAHVVSSAYVQDALAQAHLGFSAGSYQDMTRVATVDPDIWTDLFLANRLELSKVLDRLISRLDAYRQALDEADADCLHDLLAKGREAKNSAK